MTAPVDPFAPDKSNPFGVAPLGDEVLAIENGFWTASPELEYICATAHSRDVGRWGLLGAVLASLLSWVPPYIVLPDADGSTTSIRSGGSLNFFLHLVAESGEGKGRVESVADEIMPPNTRRYGTENLDLDLLTNTTGEGLVKHVVGVRSVKDEEGGKASDSMIQTTSVVVVKVDEVSNYIAELTRQGSKAAGILTSLWSGKLSGTSTSTRDNRAILPDHAARLVMVVLAQPELCGELFTDDLIAGGTPQRPVWLPADDFTECPVKVKPAGVSITPPTNMSRLLPTGGGLVSPYGGKGLPINSLPPELRFPAPTQTPDECAWITRPPAADIDMAKLSAHRAATKLSPAQKAALTTEQREARKGERIQRHAVLTRLKVMVALAALHGRVMNPTNADWELSGVVMRVNLGMLSWMHIEAEKRRLERSVRIGRDRAEEKHAESESLEEKVAKEKADIADLLWQKLATEGPMQKYKMYFGGDRKKKLIPVVIKEESAKDSPRIFVDDDGMCFAVHNGTLITQGTMRSARG